MNKEALGVIETVGMAAAIQAADTCVKSANVELIGYELTKGSGLVTIKIRGNVGAVKAAIEAAKVSAAAINKVYATLIIPRPAEKLEGIIESEATVGIKANEVEVKNSVEEEDKAENNVEEENKDRIEDNTDIQEEIEDKTEQSVSVEEQSKDEVGDHENFEEENEDSLEDSAVQEKNGDVETVDQNSECDQISEVHDDVEGEDKTLASDDLVLDSPRSEEEVQEEKPDEENSQETEESSQDDSSLNEQENDEICNICHDPACTRKKGQPKTLCINYKGTRR